MAVNGILFLKIYTNLQALLHVPYYYCFVLKTFAHCLCKHIQTIQLVKDVTSF